MPALQYDSFRRELQKGELHPAYYLHGDEDFLKDEALRDLLAKALDPATRDFNFDRRRAADLTADEFATLALTPPMMAERRIVVITDVEDLGQRRTRAQATRAAIVEYLAHPAPETLLVLVQGDGEKPDPELQRGATAVHIGALEPDRVQRWILHHATQLGLALEPDAAAHLARAVQHDLAHLAAELAKLRAAIPDRPATIDDVADLVGVRRGETAHDFHDAVTGRAFGTAADMVPHLLEAPGTSAVRLLIGLAQVMAGLALARALLDGGARPAAVQSQVEKAIAYKVFGLRGWGEEARRWTADAARWSSAECDAAYGELLRADRRLKSATLGDDAAILREAILAMGARAAAGAP